MSATLPALDRIDPADAWRPWAPTPADPWSRKWAAHLFRRAAFGPSRDDLAAAEKLGPAGTLDLLMTGRPGSDVTARTLADIGRVAAGRGDNGEQLRGWWLYAMLHGGHPLREKLTLFWHTHFATSINKVRDAAVMFRQNELFRTHALGTFGPLLQAVGRDPAMLVWLDSNSNVKGKPNENYAREVMELFALGVGNYTETDIREAARAFTGWHTDGDAFRFNAALHDDGPKTVFGKTGNWDGGDVVRLVLERPACAKFLVGKLYTFLVSEEPPPAALLDPLADTFRKSDYDVAALVRTVLGSRLFYSEHAFRKRIKGPVEYVLGAVQAVYRRLPETDPEYRPVPQQVLVRRLAAMGQVLFAPPNVKGWPGGRAWLNTATVLERSNFAAALASGALWAEAGGNRSTAGAGTGFRDPVPAPAVTGDGAPPAVFDPARLLREENATRPADAAAALLDYYVPGGVRPEARAKLDAYLADGAPTGGDLARRAREATHAILTMPEYQLA